MKKKILMFLSSMLFLSGCGSLGGNNETSNGIAEIKMTADKSQAYVYDEIKLSYEFIDKKGDTLSSEKVKKDNIVDNLSFYKKIGDGDFTNSRGGLSAYKPSTDEVHTLYVEYKGLKSNEVSITVEWAEKDKNIFSYNELSDGTVTIYGGNRVFLNKVKDLVIPAEIDGKKVSAIRSAGFSSTEIESLHFESGLSKNFAIGENAFKNCSKLRNVVIPYEVTDVGEDAFNGLASDARIFLEHGSKPSGYYYKELFGYWNGGKDNVYYNMKDFEDTQDFLYGFHIDGTVSIIQSYLGDKSIAVPDTHKDLDITVIERSAFKELNALASIKLPLYLKKINASAFKNCISLERVDIPNKVEFIGEDAFNGCSKLSIVHIPFSVTTIEEDAFKGNSNDLVIFVEAASKPAGFYYEPLLGEWTTAIVVYNVKSSIIKDDFLYGISVDNKVYATKYLGRESNVVVPDSVNGLPVTQIKYRCFYNNSLLIKITLSSNLEIVEKQAFKGCSNLLGFTIPASCTTFGEEAFSGCTSLDTLILPKTLLVCEENCFKSDTKLTLYVESGTRPSGYYNGYNQDVKATYYGLGVTWYIDPNTGLPTTYIA